MAFVINKSVTFDQLLRSARWKEVRCTDPDCTHQAPLLYACAVDYQGHRVRVIQDWNCFSVQIDGDPRLMVENVSHAQMLEYVKQVVKENGENTL
jgi:hypothetical protein